MNINVKTVVQYWSIFKKYVIKTEMYGNELAKKRARI